MQFICRCTPQVGGTQLKVFVQGKAMVDVAMQYDTGDEPIGIIISRGSRQETPPRLSAYVWGPVPDEPEVAEGENSKVA